MNSAHGIRGFPDGQKRITVGKEEAEKPQRTRGRKEGKLSKAVCSRQDVAKSLFFKESKYILTESDLCTQALKSLPSADTDNEKPPLIQKAT